MASNFVVALRDAVRSAFCAALAVNINALRYFRRRGFPNQLQLEVAERTRRWLCSNDEIPDFGFEGVPGRCPGVLYQDTVVANCRLFNRVSGLPDATYQATYRINSIGGPLGQPILPGFVVGGFSNPKQGPPLQLANDAGVAIANYTVIETTNPGSNTGSNQALSLVGRTVVRLDGLPDDCEIIEDPVPITGPISITYNNNNNIEVTEEGDITIFAPILDINGELTIPVNVNLGGLNIPINLNLDGEISLNNENNFNFGTPTDTPSPTPEDDEPPPEQGQLIIGAIVRVTSNAQTTSGLIVQNENPDIIIPRAGSIQFQYQIGGRKIWSNDIDVKNANAWIPAPPPGFALRVAGTPVIGVQWTITPIYRTPPRPE